MKRILLATALAASAIAGSAGAASAHQMLLYGENANGHKAVQIFNETPTTGPTVTKASATVTASDDTGSAQPMLLYGMTAKGHKTVPVYNEHPLASNDGGSFVAIGSSQPDRRG